MDTAIQVSPTVNLDEEGTVTQVMAMIGERLVSHTRLASQVQHLIEQVASLQARTAELEAKVKETEERAFHASVERDDAKQALDSEKQDNANLRLEIEHLRASQIESNRQRSELQARFDACQRELRATKQDLDYYQERTRRYREDTIPDLQKQVDTHRADLTTLRKEHKEKSDQLDRVREILGSFQVQPSIIEEHPRPEAVTAEPEAPEVHETVIEQDKEPAPPESEATQAKPWWQDR